jgi:hypothetical protein
MEEKKITQMGDFEFHTQKTNVYLPNKAEILGLNHHKKENQCHTQYQNHLFGFILGFFRDFSFSQNHNCNTYSEKLQNNPYPVYWSHRYIYQIKIRIE